MVAPDNDESSSEDGGVTPGGSRLYRHTKRVPSEIVHGDAELIQAVSDHMERCVGPIHMVLHEIVSDLVHVDIHWIKPAPERPYHVLFTTGMGEAPMNMPNGMEPRRAELIAALPADWPLSQEAFKDEANYWPVRWLKLAARLPHEYDTWLGPGHTIPNGDPAEPFAPGTNLSGVMITLPYMLRPEDAVARHQGRDVHLLSLMPLTAAEMRFKLDRGAEALEDRIEKLGLGVHELFRAGRPCAVTPAKKPWWRFGKG